MGCPSHKVGYETSLQALATFDRVITDPLLGSIYTCQSCGQFHISSRRFSAIKPKGKGKARSGIARVKV
jgi:hypothetical protein